jgi:hypothetical protein
MQPPEGSDHQAAATTVCPAAKALTGSTQDEAKVYHLDENLVRMPPHMLPLRPGLLAQLCASLLQANREAGHATDRCIHASLRCFLMGGPTCDVPLLRQGLGYNVADCAIVSGPPNAYTVYRPDLLVTVCKTVACIQVNLEAIIEGKPYELLYARVPDPEEGRPKPAFLAASHLEYRCQLDTPKVKALLRESRHMAHGAYSTHTQVEYWKRGRKVILPDNPATRSPHGLYEAEIEGMAICLPGFSPAEPLANSFRRETVKLYALLAKYYPQPQHSRKPWLAMGYQPPATDDE